MEAGVDPSTTYATAFLLFAYDGVVLLGYICIHLTTQAGEECAESCIISHYGCMGYHAGNFLRIVKVLKS